MNNQKILKFRVWDKTLNKWVNHISAINANGNLLYLSVTVDDKNEIKHNIYTVSPERSIIQQFTGLLDKNNKEIYEGDIMASCGNYTTDNLDKNGNNLNIYCVVVWNIKMSRFALKPIDEYKKHLLNPPDPKLDHPWVCSLNAFKEVIGNVFENPQLLDSQKNIDIKENNEYDDKLETCPNCEENAWDGNICHNCGAKDI